MKGNAHLRIPAVCGSQSADNARDRFGVYIGTREFEWPGKQRNEQASRVCDLPIAGNVTLEAFIVHVLDVDRSPEETSRLDVVDVLPPDSV